MREGILDLAPDKRIVELQMLIEIALRAARVAGEISRRHFLDHNLAVDLKDDGTPVTSADRQAEEAMREILRQGAPELGIFGEEYGHEGDLHDRWIIDPIDGTQNFIDGVPDFAALIGLQLEGQSVLGVVHCSVLGSQEGAPEQLGQSWWDRELVPGRDRGRHRNRSALGNFKVVPARDSRMHSSVTVG